METIKVLPLTTSVNRHNLGRLILAARAVAVSAKRKSFAG